jgi:predicted alpha/beta hydrolase family esterase
MKKVIIVHGYTGYPDKNWFPWLRSDLEKLGILVEVPEMPNTNQPKLEEWLPHLQQTIGVPNIDTFLVGHSLGCPTILRYLESLDDNQQVGGSLLVAGFAEPLPHLPKLDGFTSDAWKYSYTQSRTKKLTIINSDDDEAVPFFNAEHVRDRFNAKLVTVHGAGHINEKSGYKKAPFILDELKEMMGL